MDNPARRGGNHERATLEIGLAGRMQLTTMTALALAKTCLALLNPPPALKIWEWAEKNRRMGLDISAKTGAYSVDFAPYQKEPQESFVSPEVERTVLVMAIRMGKTEMVNNLYGATIEQSPRRILHMTSTEVKGKQYSKEGFMPMVRSTECLKNLIRDSRAQYGGNTILSKEFPGGSITIIGSNSENAPRQVVAPVVFCDEVDSYEPSKHGDPVTRAFGRSRNYRNSIRIMASTPKWLETSQIWKAYLNSDQRKWFCKCPDCSAFHVLAFGNVKMPKKDAFKEAFYECPECTSKWDDSKRLKAIRAGEWRPTAPFNGIRGYWLNGLNTVFEANGGFVSNLHQFAKEAHDAEAEGEMTKQVWTNEFLCEPTTIKAEEIDQKPLIERKEAYTGRTLPNRVLFIVCAVDVQKHRLEYEIIGQGESEETWGIEYGKIMGDTDGDEVWKDLANKLSQRFTRKDGVELGIACTAIDHGYRGEYVMKFIRRGGIPRVFAVRGVNRSRQESLIMTNEKRRLTSVNSDAAKDLIFSRLQLIEEGPRFMHFPVSYDNEYFTQLTSEKKETRYKNGFAIYEYHKKQSVRNEALDIRVYSLGAVKKLNPNIEKIKESIEAQKTEHAPRPYHLKGPNEKAIEKEVSKRRRMQFAVPQF
jgi:phage terminase large subunit GpA-like protein